MAHAPDVAGGTGRVVGDATGVAIGVLMRGGVEGGGVGVVRAHGGGFVGSEGNIGMIRGRGLAGEVGGGVMTVGVVGGVGVTTAGGVTGIETGVGCMTGVEGASLGGVVGMDTRDLGGAIVTPLQMVMFLRKGRSLQSVGRSPISPKMEPLSAAPAVLAVAVKKSASVRLSTAIRLWVNEGMECVWNVKGIVHDLI